MAARLVSYHLKSLEKADYDGFAQVLQTYDYMQISETCYAIASEESPNDIFLKLEPFIDPDDCLVVIVLSGSYMAHHDKHVLEWLEENV